MADRDTRPRGHHFKSPQGAPTRQPGAYQQPVVRQAQASPQSRRTMFDGNDAYNGYSPFDARRQPSLYGASGGSRSGGRRGKRRSKVPFIVLGVLLVLIVSLAGAGFAVLSSAKSLKAQASTVLSGIETITDSVASQDYIVASQSAESIATATAEMVDELRSPIWSVASLIPVYGEDVSSVRTLVDALGAVASDALVPVTQALEANPPASLISADKTINVEAVGRIFDALSGAAPAVQECADTVSALPAMHISQLEELMGPARERIDKVNDLVQTASAFGPLAKSVLGAEGDRVYLIAAQNSAEMRASGGFPGSIGTMSIRSGRIELGDFSKVYDVMAVSTPASCAITDEEYSLFGGWMETARDSGMNPDFPRVAEIWAAAYGEKTGTRVDGVISVTPSVVQDLLAIAGSITLSDGTVLDGTNATKVLQHDLYWKYLSGDSIASGAGDVADALFAEAAELAFDQFFSGLDSSTLMSLVEVMAGGIENRTIMFWLADEANQETLTSAGCTGSVKTDPSQPAVGTYFSLWIGSKMGWYIDIDNQILSSHDNADGTRTYSVQTTFTNAATSDIVVSAGDYIAGYLGGFDRDNLYPELWLYAPTGGSISSLAASNGAVFSEGQYEGLQVFHASRPDLRAGESIVCTYEVTTAVGAEELAFMATPTLTAYR